MRKILTVMLVALFALPLAALAHEERGAENMELYGGKRGKVPFPHHLHQDVLGNCKVCHSVFPKKAGSIEAMKASGELKSKRVMNGQCTKCHKTTIKNGGKAGPTKCNDCHVKPKKK
jgi:uncharacterized membrane protein